MPFKWPTAAGRRLGVLTPVDGTDRATSMRFSVSERWILTAASLPGRSLNLAIVLVLQAHMQRKLTVPFSNRLGALIGADRNAKYRALTWLEEAGLVRVERRIGCSPLVTLIDVEPGS